MRVLACVLFSVASLVLNGCNRGPTMYHVSGTVTFDGQPVPAGRIEFNPDFTQKNDGPQGFADIKNGTFDTRKGGQGHGGGPIVIRIEGFDGKSSNPESVGTPIFAVHEIKRDLPKESSTQTLEVPKSAAAGLVVPTGPGP